MLVIFMLIMDIIRYYIYLSSNDNKDFWIQIDTESNIPAVDYIKKLESKPNWDWRLTDDLYIDSDELEKIIAAGKKTIDDIINGLDEKVRTLPNIRTRVIEILGRLGKFEILGDDVIDILLMALKNDSVDARESACYALADNLSFLKVIPVLSQQKIISYLRHILITSKETNDIRYAAVSVLNHLDHKEESIFILEEVMDNDEDEEVCEAAYNILIRHI